MVVFPGSRFPSIWHRRRRGSGHFWVSATPSAPRSGTPSCCPMTPAPWRIRCSPALSMRPFLPPGPRSPWTRWRRSWREWTAFPPRAVISFRSTRISWKATAPSTSVSGQASGGRSPLTQYGITTGSSSTVSFSPRTRPRENCGRWGLPPIWIPTPIRCLLRKSVPTFSTASATGSTAGPFRRRRT